MKKREGLKIKHPPYYVGVKTEVFGNTRAVIEGCTGVHLYKDDTVKIKTAKMNICFTGRNLKITCLDKDSLIVEGFILSVSYIM